MSEKSRDPSNAQQQPPPILTTQEIADTSGHVNQAIAQKQLQEASDSLAILTGFLDCVRKSYEPAYETDRRPFWTTGEPVPLVQPPGGAAAQRRLKQKQREDEKRGKKNEAVTKR